MRITDLTNIRHAVQSSAWVIHEPKLQAIAAVLSRRLHEAPLTAEEIQAAIGDRPTRGASVSGSVAVIPLAGTLYPKANIVTQSSGGASVEQFVAQVEAAANDPSVTAIVIDTDSPGGAAQGIPEAAARLRALRGSKPIVAVASGMMASGAYWLASQADSIVGAPSAEIGSVGAFMVHQDLSEAYAKEGVKNTIVRAGQFKAETNPYEPLTDEAREALQTRVDDAYAMFVADVAKGRRVAVGVVKSDFGQGRVMNSRAALSAGMIDKLGTLQSVVRDLSGPKAKQYLRAANDALPVFADADVCAGGGVVQNMTDLVFATETTYGTPLEVAPMRAGVSEAVLSSSISEPPLAEEPTVDTPTNAAPVAAVPDRATQLSELALLTNNASQLPAWIQSGKSVSDIQKELLAAQSAPSPIVSVGVQRETQKPWESLGHFGVAIAAAATPGVRASEWDPRLLATATGAGQSIPSDGGFAVPAQFNNSLWEGLFSDTTSLLSMTDNYDVEGEFIEFLAVDDTTRATGSVFGGVSARWINEADQIANTKPKFRKMRLEPQELAAMCFITDKLIQNSPVAMGQFLDRGMRGAVALKVNEALIGGDGVGKPKGLSTSPAKIIVNKEASQANGTILAANIAKMKARRIASIANQYVWLYNTDCETELEFLSTTVKNVAGTENVGGFGSPMWNSSTNTLGGLRAIPNDHCGALGTETDIMLVHLPSYAVALRRAGFKTAQSMHLRFDYAEQAFRGMFDIDGQTWLNSALTPAKGNTKSTVITLQAR